MRVFVDTNLWVYRLDRREPQKSAFIRDWLRGLARVDIPVHGKPAFRTM